MKHLGAAILIVVAWRVAAQPAVAPVTIDYPEEGSIFPPEITPPTFIWREPSDASTVWRIDVVFADGVAALQIQSKGERMVIGEIDRRAISDTNELPRLTLQQASSHTWIPDRDVWRLIKQHSVEHPARVTITGFRDSKFHRIVARGSVNLQTSRDAVGAPIFYRDVPLMPSELEKGVIKPLAASAVPLISWKVRSVGERSSRVVLEGLHLCANCHSFSADGKTLGMDLDGPQNDKGLYAVASVQPRMTIRNQDVISWSSFNEQPAGKMRVGFMSQISPDGRYVVTTVGVEKDLSRNYYVANFRDYRFLQVFYATRGVLAWYDRVTGQRRSLPGADDPRFVQTNGVWSPDGKYLVFARAEGRDAYSEGRKMAGYANDPNEAPVQYDLYRVPFDEGRGGHAEPVAGASQNGMSNSFPRVSPDGRWIVFVQARNGLLMRPDSRLYIVPAGGGTARPMRCNLAVMNSWHSFSPNGRWMVFASKGRSPYTQMYLTHLDEDGNDSPAILIDNATAANRAVNLPEFVNMPEEGLLHIDVPAAEFSTRFDQAWELAEKGKYPAAIAEWNRALEINPADARAENNLAFAHADEHRLDEAVAHWKKALELDDHYAEVHKNLASALSGQGRVDEAMSHWRKALELGPEDSGVRASLGVALLQRGLLDDAIAQLRKAGGDSQAHYNLGLAFLRKGLLAEAIGEYQSALALNPSDAQAESDLGVALVQQGKVDEALGHFARALEIDPRFAQGHFNLGNAFYLRGKPAEAIVEWRSGLRIQPDNLQALQQLCWVLATSPEASQRNGAEALRFGARAMELSGGADPLVLDTLAAAYAEAGQFEDALRTAGRARTLAMEQNNRALAERLGARISLYEQHAPFRDSR